MANYVRRSDGYHRLTPYVLRSDGYHRLEQRVLRADGFHKIDTDSVVSGDTGGNPGGSPSESLFFDVDDSILQSAISTNRTNIDKLVFAHFFAHFGLAMSDTTPWSYYRSQWLNTAATSEVYPTYGGFLREVPLSAGTVPRTPRGGWTVKQEIAASEIKIAMQGLIDGFFCDILWTNTGDHQWQWMDALAFAAQNDPDIIGKFFVVPYLDPDSSNLRDMIKQQNGKTYADAAALCDRLSATSPVLPSGERLVGIYDPPGLGSTLTAADWSGFATYLQNNIANYSGGVRFVASFTNWSDRTSYDDPVFQATGPWSFGAVVAGTTNSTSADAAAIGQGDERAYLSVKNVRPSQTKADEPENLDAMTAGWERIVTDQPRFTELVTWGDHSEGGGWAPTNMNGHVPLDVSAWYIAALKTGSYPTILTDAAYLSHHQQLRIGSGTSIAAGSPQTNLMTAFDRGASQPTPRNKIQVDIFAKTNGLVIKIWSGCSAVGVRDGTLSTSSTLGTGHQKFTADEAIGYVCIAIEDGGLEVISINSPVEIQNQVWASDQWGYYMMGNIRGTADVYRATQNTDGSQPTWPTPTSLTA